MGAGPGGLAAAILLAGAGLQVTVLETTARVGGRTSTLEADGFRFDTGPTFFLYPQVLEEIFASVGYDLHREVVDGAPRPAVPARLRRRGRPAGHPGPRARWTGRSPRCRRTTRARSAGSWTTTGTSSSASARASSRRSSAGRTSLSPACCSLLPCVRPWRSLDRRARPLLQRSADPARLLLPVEVPGDVPLPVPEPVLDPLLPGVRVRRLPPDRRLRRGDRGDGPGGAGAGRGDPARGGGAEILFEGRRAVGRAHRRRHLPLGRPADQRRLRPRHDAAGARPPAPPLDGRADRAQEVLLLDLHALPGDRRALRRRLPPHDLHLRGLRAEPGRDREPARPLGRSVVLRPERRRDRPDAGAAGQEHALRPRAGHPPAPERRLEPRERSASAPWPSRGSRRSASRTSSAASASSGW